MLHVTVVKILSEVCSTYLLYCRLKSDLLLVVCWFKFRFCRPFDANHNTWAPCAAGCMRSMAHSRTRRTTRRTEPLPIMHVGQWGLVGGVRKVRHQACELCTSHSCVLIGVPTKGRDRAPSTIYKRRTRFPPRLRGAYGRAGHPELRTCALVEGLGAHNPCSQPGSLPRQELKG